MEDACLQHNDLQNLSEMERIRYSNLAIIIPGTSENFKLVYFFSLKKFV